MNLKSTIFSLSLLASATVGYAVGPMISGGGNFGMALGQDGNIWTWGQNFYVNADGACLGIDPDNKVSKDTAVYVPSLVKSDLRFKKVHASTGFSSFAVSTSGIAYYWGRHHLSNDGLPNHVPSVSFPTPLPKGETEGYNLDGKAGGDYLGDVVDICGSNYAGFALLGNGRVVSWGFCSYINSLSDQAVLEPIYVKDQNGKPIENVIAISGGDEYCMFLVDNDGDGKGEVHLLGKLYRIENSEYPVPVVTEGGDVLDNVIKIAAGDVLFLALDVNGSVWAAGDNGYGGCLGIGMNKNANKFAARVLAGDYRSISGKEYLDNVVDIDAGRAFGSAVTKDGYLLCWGNSVGSAGVGGAIANPDVKSEAKDGPVFSYYCDKDHSSKGAIVDNAMSVSLGDNFGFSADKDNNLYSWGNNEYGQCGLGNEFKEVSYSCLSPIQISGGVMSGSPVLSLSSKVKFCPGEEVVLNCGMLFNNQTRPYYYFAWYKDGVLLNSSKPQPGNSDEAKSDIYNTPVLSVFEAGKYKLVIYHYYFIDDATVFENAVIECSVEEFEKPIRDVKTESSCDENEYTYTLSVNDNFYGDGKKTTWNFYATPESTEPVFVKKDVDSGHNYLIRIPAYAIDESQLTDTSASVWVEDANSLSTVFFEDMEYSRSNYLLDNGLLVNVKSDCNFKSFDLKLSSFVSSSVFKVTPIVYTTKINSALGIEQNEVFWTGKTLQLTLSNVPQFYTIPCDVVLPGTDDVDGVTYFLSLKVEGSGCQAYSSYIAKAVASNDALFVTPYLNQDGVDVSIVGSMYSQYLYSDNVYMANLVFEQESKYSCGRMKLTSYFKCDFPEVKTIDEMQFLVEEGGLESDFVDNDTRMHLNVGDSIRISLSSDLEDGLYDLAWYIGPANQDEADDVLVAQGDGVSNLPLVVTYDQAYGNVQTNFQLRSAVAEEHTLRCVLEVKSKADSRIRVRKPIYVVADGIPTSVDQIVSEEFAADASVSVFNIAGQKIKDGVYGNLDLNPGLYIISCDNLYKKVVIK